MAKHILILLILLSAVRVSVGQGTVLSGNSPSTLFQTNDAFFGTSGNIAPVAGAFYFEVLTAPSTVTSVDSSLQGLLSAPWSDTGLQLTNTTLASGGRISGPSGANGVVANWPSFQMQSFIVVGWSSELGSTWAAARNSLVGAVFTPDSGSYYFQSENVLNYGFIGASMVQAAESGQPDGTAAFGLFGAVASPQGTPITTPTTLYLITDSPEPSAALLLGVWACGLIARRAKRV